MLALYHLAARFSGAKQVNIRIEFAHRRTFCRTTETGVRDFCDTSCPLAGPDRSQVATTEKRIRRKPRKYRDKSKPMPCPEKPFYNNNLCLAVQAVWGEPVSG